MGIAFAFPNAVYEMRDCSVQRVSSTHHAWPPTPPKVSVGTVTKVVQALTGIVTGVVNGVASTVRSISAAISSGDQDAKAAKKPTMWKEVKCEWNEAKYRKNTTIFLRLEKRGDGDAALCVCNYHMPCAFYAVGRV
jgi:hypothetical protein